MSVNLQYNYAQVDLETGWCGGCMTTSYEINMDGFIEVPVATDDYVDKYYNFDNGMWYWDAEFTQLWEECPSHNV